MNTNNNSCVFAFGDYRLDADEGLLRRNGLEVPLTPTLLEILLVLVEASGRIVPKEHFMERVWPGRFVEEGNLARNVSTLRKLLDDDPQQPCYIETVPRRGYRFVAEITVETARLAGPPGRPARPAASRFPAWPPAIGAALLLVAGLVVAAVTFTIRGPESELPRRSIVVLPFENLSGDPSQMYVADGLTRELISRLGQHREFSVTSSTSAWHYRDSGKEPHEIARELGAEIIVEGDVSRDGEIVRATVRATEAGTGRTLTESFVHSINDLLSLPKNIADAVALDAGIDIERESSPKIAARTEIGHSAQEAYLHGVFFKNKRTVESLERAISYFEQAIALEPAFAPAHAALADSYLVLASWQGPSRELWPRARAAANRALELDASLALAHLVRAGALLCHDLDAAAAEPIFLRALEINPSDSMTLTRYGYSLMVQGRFEESIEWLRKSLDVDPVSLANNTVYGSAFHFAGRYDDAVRQLMHTLDLDAMYPEAHRVLGLVYLETGEHEKAVSALETALSLGGGQGVAGELGYAYGVAGRIDDAREQLATLKDLSNRGRDSAYSLALVHHGLGDDDRTFEWLEKAYGERDFRMIRLLVDPIWDDLRPDPRFADLLNRVGLRPAV